MAFNIKAYSVLVSLTKEAMDVALLPLRVRAAKAKAESEVIKLEEQLLQLETSINEQCAKKELNLTLIVDLIDSYELIERRLKQINTLIEQLFPVAS